MDERMRVEGLDLMRTMNDDRLGRDDERRGLDGMRWIDRSSNRDDRVKGWDGLDEMMEESWRDGRMDDDGRRRFRMPRDWRAHGRLVDDGVS